MYAGFVTERPSEARDFYVGRLGFEIVFESDWFLLVALGSSRIAFMRPALPFVPPVFRQPFGGGAWVALDVDDVDESHARVVARGVAPLGPPTTEAWGERHFVVIDPLGIALDFVKFVGPPA